MLFVYMTLSLLIILISCSLFTNSIEWLGKKLNLGDGVVGSIFSAVGTCLPETMVPIIAIFFAGSVPDADEIGVGAIIGAPFMLGTLAFFITGASVIILRRKRKSGLKLMLDMEIIERDLAFFLVFFSLAVYAGIFLSEPSAKLLVAIAISAGYLYYIVLTVKKDGGSHPGIEDLFLTKLIKIRPGFKIIILQMLLALFGILYGANNFVFLIENISKAARLSPLALSLLLTPVATELPEKFNSVMWIGKNKDTLAIGNLTGAMVFQSCIPVALGIVATDWKFNQIALTCSSLVFASALVFYLTLKCRKSFELLSLLSGGVFYLIYLNILLKYVF